MTSSGSTQQAKISFVWVIDHNLTIICQAKEGSFFCVTKDWIFHHFSLRIPTATPPIPCFKQFNSVCSPYVMQEHGHAQLVIHHVGCVQAQLHEGRFISSFFQLLPNSSADITPSAKTMMLCFTTFA